MDDSYIPKEEFEVDTQALAMANLLEKIRKEFERRIGQRVSSFFLNESKEGFIVYYYPSVKAGVMTWANGEAKILFEKYKEEIAKLLEG